MHIPRHHRLAFLVVPWLLLALLIPGPIPVRAQTPPQLDSVVEKFKSTPAGETEARLQLAYAALDLYAPLPAKSIVAADDRPTLSQMKRLVLLDAIGQVHEPALVAAIGTTGHWLRQNTEFIRNDYSADDQQQITDNKLRGCYMEGLSDLDFPVMGAHARAFSRQVHEILAQGKGGSGLTPHELEQLEISFLVDDQIRSLQANGQPKRFWQEMLDVEKSSYHPEKYITKGGKALYCLEHLELRGAAMRPGQEPQAFSVWVTDAGHQLGEFGLPHLIGGACDMDYFLDHACEKQQPPVKTALQVIKYLRRQEWMLEQAASHPQLAEGLTVDQQRIGELKTLAQTTDDYWKNAADNKIWISHDFNQFKTESRQMSARVCERAHSFAIELGNDLLGALGRSKLSVEQAQVLHLIVYDLQTIHSRRYAHGYPQWYDDERQSETEAFLAAYHSQRSALEDVFFLARERPPWDEDLAAIEIGPIKPPPVATVRALDPSYAILSGDAEKVPEAGDEIEFRFSIELDGVLEKPADDTLELDPSQQKLMHEAALTAWRGMKLRHKVAYLIALNQNNESSDTKIYVSLFEIDQLLEELETDEFYLQDLAERLHVEPPDTAAQQQEPWSNPPQTAALADVGLYLEQLDAASERAQQTLDVIDKLSAKAAPAAKKLGYENAAEELVDIQRRAQSIHKTLAEFSAQKEKFVKLAEDLDKMASGDTETMASRSKELSDYLAQLADQVEEAAVESQSMRGTLSTSFHQFRQQAASGTALTELDQLIGSWDQQRDDLLLRDLPAAQRHAEWLRRGSWFAKSVGEGLEMVTVIRHAVDEHEKVENQLKQGNLSQQTENAVRALWVCGRVIQTGSRYIPIPVLRDVVHDYASLLADAPKWATAFDQLLQMRSQNVFGFRALEPAAYVALLNQHEKTLGPQGEFYHHVGPFAKYNELRLAVHPTPLKDTDAKARQLPQKGILDPATIHAWLIWDKDSPTGFLPLTGEQLGPNETPLTFKQASLLAAWFRRVQGTNVTGPQLKDLLTEGSCPSSTLVRWYSRAFGPRADRITAQQLELEAATALEREVWAEYLSKQTNLQLLDASDARRLTRTINHAARALATEGFFLRDRDIADLFRGEGGGSANVGQRSQKARQKESLFEVVFGFAGERQQKANLQLAAFDEAVQRLLEKKRLARQHQREKAWEAARERSAAGLLRRDVKIVVDHTIYWPGDRLTRREVITAPSERSFACQARFALPAGFDPSRAKYVARVSILGYDDTAYDIDFGFKSREFLLDWHQVVGQTGVEPAPKPVEYPSACVSLSSAQRSISLNLSYLDMLEYAKARSRGIQGGTPADRLTLDKLGMSSPVHNAYRGDLLCRITCNGQSHYAYKYYNASTWMGAALHYGLTPGLHPVQMAIVTSDHDELQMDLTIRVLPPRPIDVEDADKYEKNVEHYQEAFELAKQKVQEAKANRAAATSDRDIRNAEEALKSAYRKLVSDGDYLSSTSSGAALVIPRGKPVREQVPLELLRQAYQTERYLFETVPEEYNQPELRIARIIGLPSNFRQIGNTEAFQLAREAIEYAEGQPELLAEANQKWRGLELAYRSMADLAISSTNDLALATRYRDAANRAKAQLGIEIDQKEIELWPQQMSIPEHLIKPQKPQ